jgi:type IV secretory pathway VirB6-like protein
MIRSAATTITKSWIRRSTARAFSSDSSPSQQPIQNQKQKQDSSYSSSLTYEVIPKEDFGEFKEYSVIFTNRALNLMSSPFQRVMRDLNALLKETYRAEKVVIIPG